MPIVTLPLPYQIANGQTEDAAPVMGNFNYLAAQVNANVPVPTAATTNTAYGWAALGIQTALPGASNTAFGWGTLAFLANNLAHANNAAFGTNALLLAQITSGTTALGAGTLQSLTVGGNFHTAVGNLALYSLNTNAFDGATAVGFKAGYAGGAAGFTAVGYEAGMNTVPGGSDCTAIGYQALLANQGGGLNTAVGKLALNSNVSGANNTGVGANAGAAITTGGNNSCFGSNATVSAAAASNRTAVGAFANCTTDNSVQLGGNAVTALTVGGAGTATLGTAALPLKGIHLDYTNTAVVGAVVINKPSGRVNIAAGTSNVTITNSLVTAASHVLCCPSGIGLTPIGSVVPQAGSFIIFLTAITVADQAIDFLVINAD